MSNADIVRSISIKYFDNAEEVISAYIQKRRRPPLKLKSGLTIYHEANDLVEAIFPEIFISSAYTDPDFYTPAQHDVVVDCGAHIGIFALYLLSQQPKLTVYCFEPNPVPFKTLKMNIDRNGLNNQIKAFPIGIMDSRQQRLLRHYPYSTASGTLFQPAKDEPCMVENVQCMSLQEAFEHTGIVRADLLKIDTEGAEIEILRGAHETASLDSIARVVTEIHEFIRPGSLATCSSMLQSNGFAVHLREITSPLGFTHQTLYGLRKN